MKLTKTQIVGWVLTALLALMLIVVSASGKFRDFEGKAEMFEKLGYSLELMTKIGIVEVVITLLFLVPRTAFFGAVLLTGYLGGATATHVRVGDPFVFPIILGVLVWVALGLRQPEVFRVALGAKQSSAD